jgi:hypothetical protein
VTRIVELTLELVGLIRSGDLLSNRVRIIQLVGEILVCLGNYLETSEQVFADLPDSTPNTIADCCDELAAQLGGDDDASTVNPLVLLIVRRLIKLLIDELL